MKTTSIKALLILGGSMLISKSTFAGIGEKIKSLATSEYANFQSQGLYVVGGIVMAALIVYLLVNHFSKGQDEVELKPQRNPHAFSHQRRHHHQRIVKKTA